MRDQPRTTGPNSKRGCTLWVVVLAALVLLTAVTIYILVDGPLPAISDAVRPSNVGQRAPAP